MSLKIGIVIGTKDGLKAPSFTMFIELSLITLHEMCEELNKEHEEILKGLPLLLNIGYMMMHQRKRTFNTQYISYYRNSYTKIKINSLSFRYAILSVSPIVDMFCSVNVSSNG